MAARSETFVLVDPVGDQIVPISARAFERITSPVAQVLSRNCVALFLGADGQVVRIDDIYLTKSNLGARLGLWLGCTAPAQVSFLKVATTLEDVRTMILDAMTFTRRRGVADTDWWLLTADEAQVRKELGAATNLAELYDRLRVPLADARLDLL